VPYRLLRALTVFCAVTLALVPSVSATQSSAYFQNCQSGTGENATVILTESVLLLYLKGAGDIQPIATNGEIAAFTLDGQCVGRVVRKNGTSALAIWGDDVMTPQKDGYAPGELITFRVWSPTLQLEFSSIRVLYDSAFGWGDTFQTDAIYKPSVIQFYPTQRMGSLTGGDAAEAARAGEQASTEAAARSASRVAVPDAFTLASNYPNPFSTSTTIRYGLPETADVRLDVYDALGRRVATLVDENQSAAWHEVQFRADDLAPGVYIYRFRANDFVSQRQMLLVR